jgi:hypothetical protein
VQIVFTRFFQRQGSLFVLRAFQCLGVTFVCLLNRYFPTRSFSPVTTFGFWVSFPSSRKPFNLTGTVACGTSGSAPATGLLLQSATLFG